MGIEELKKAYKKLSEQHSRIRLEQYCELEDSKVLSAGVQKASVVLRDFLRAERSLLDIKFASIAHAQQESTSGNVCDVSKMSFSDDTKENLFEEYKRVNSRLNALSNVQHLAILVPLTMDPSKIAGVEKALSKEIETFDFPQGIQGKVSSYIENLKKKNPKNVNTFRDIYAYKMQFVLQTMLMESIVQEFKYL